MPDKANVQIDSDPAIAAAVRQKVIGTVYREMPIEISMIDQDNRTLQISASSEIDVLRTDWWWGTTWLETLGHDPDEVRMERIECGAATVHWNHSRRREDRIGAVEKGWLEGGRLNAIVRLSKRQDIDDIWGDLVDNLIRNVSVGYKIHEKILVEQSDDKPDRFRVIDWEPMEISFCDIPADPTVGVGRNNDDGQPIMYRVIDLEPPSTREAINEKETDMSDKDKENAKPADDEGKRYTDTDLETAKTAAATDAERRTIDNEIQRRTDIKAAFEFAPASDDINKLRERCIDDPKISVDDARKDLLEAIGKDKTASGSPHIDLEADSADKFRDGAIAAIEMRAGVPGVERDDTNELRGYTLVELARRALAVHNLPTEGSRMEMIGRAFTIRASGIGHTTSDFASILANVAHKSVLLGFSEAPETWNIWCRVGNLTDFKTAHRVQMSQFSDLELIGPGGEYKFGTFDDRGETITLATYGKMFGIDRQAIINDDLNAFTEIPMKMGRAAARVPGDLAYAVLTTNPTMGDGVVLFDAGHNNIGTPGAIAVASVEEAQTLMALQSDVSGNANGLNTQLEFLLVPVQLKGTANVLRRSEYDPADTNNSRAPNSVEGTFEVVSDPRLSADSATQWYGCAGPAFDTVEVAFLDGNQEPRIEEQDGWKIDGVEFKVALDCAAGPMEWRSFTRNAGA